MDAVQYIRETQDKTYLTRQERENLNRAKLRIAFWACRTENVIASRENLAYILGNDAIDIMSAYDKYLERVDETSRTPRGGKDGRDFWGNG